MKTENTIQLGWQGLTTLLVVVLILAINMISLFHVYYTPVTVLTYGTE